MGLNKIGISTSLDQAKALLLQTKVNKENQNIIKEEFKNLIFSTDDTLHADLT
jgi:hypothetical protein